MFGSGHERFAQLKADIHTVAWMAGFGADETKSVKWDARLAVEKLRELRATANKK